MPDIVFQRLLAKMISSSGKDMKTQGNEMMTSNQDLGKKLSETDEKVSRD